MEYLTENAEFNAELEKQVASLPSTLQELIKSSKIDEFVSSVAMRNSLSEDEEAAVLHEMGLIALKIEPVESFLSNLLSEALISPEASREIVAEATEEFFIPLKDYLMTAPLPVPTPQAMSGEHITEKPYVEMPVKKPSYEAILDVPNYTVAAKVPTSVPVPPKPPVPLLVPFIPETPAIRVQPAFKSPTSTPRAPEKLLSTENVPTPPQAQ